MESKKNAEVRKVCQNCKWYGRRSKKCSVSGGFTARKGSCDRFEPVK